MDQKQFLYAVSIASSPDASLRQQANDFLRSVQQSADQHWPLCISVFLAGAGSPAPDQPGKDGNLRCSPEARVFSLQIVDQVIGDKSRSDALSPESRQAIQDAFLDYVRTEFVEGTAEGGGVPPAVQSLLRNKVAHTLALLFICFYPVLQYPPLPATTPTMLQLLLPMLKPSVNPHTTLLILRTLVEINEEVHDTLLKSARPYTAERQERDAKLRDEVREREAPAMHEAVSFVWEEALGRMEGGEGQGWAEVVEWAVRAFGGYVPWIDITLTVTPHSLYLLNRLLQSSHSPFRLFALDALNKIVIRGFKDPGEKIELLAILSIVSALTPLEISTRAQGSSDQQILLFRERMAKLLNSFGVELGKMVAPEALAEDKTKVRAEAMLQESLPLFIQFLSDDSNDVSTAVFGFLDDILKRNKKMKKADDLTLDSSKQAFLATLLEVIIKKMAWERDQEWGLGEEDGDVDPEEIINFQNLRRQFKSAVEAIANINPEMFITSVSGIVTSTLQTFQAQGASAITWQQAELAMFLVYSWSEYSATKVSGRAAFFQIPPEVEALIRQSKQARKASFSGSDKSDSMSESVTPTNGTAVSYKPDVDYTTLPLTIQGELLVLCVQSGITNYPHPAVALQFFECSTRYSEFFRVRPDVVQPTLAALLDARGIHNPTPAVRERAFYLFHKFIKDIKPNMSVDYVPGLLESMADLLAIKPTMPERESPEEDLLLKATTVNTESFDAQCYLFETVGILVSMIRDAPQQQLGLLQAAVNPLLSLIASEIQKPVSPVNLMPVLSVHHAIMALGNIARGFPDPTERGLAMEAPLWISVMKQSTEAILATLERLNTYKIIRDASRFAFARIVSTTSTRILDYVAMFVNAIVAQFEPSELVEFLGFLSLILHKLKDTLFDVLDGLILPIIQKIFQTLAEPVTGTDDELQHGQLRAAYLSFIASIMTAKLDAVFLSSKNKPELENILNNVLSFATESNDPICQKLAFSIVAKAVIAWATNPAATPAPLAGEARSGPSAIVPPSTQVIPGFEGYIYERVLPLCLEVPSSPTFKLKDGQTQLVMSEITNLLRSILIARGQEAVERLKTGYLPSVGCPPETAADFMTQLQSLDAKGFRRWLTDFIKSARDAQAAAVKAAAEMARQ